jgi:hypothetical protein
LRPQVAFTFTVPLGYLADERLGVESVINATKVAAQNAVVETASSAPLTLASLTSAVLAVPGVESVTHVTINNAEADLASDGSDWYCGTANEILAECFIAQNA